MLTRRRTLLGLVLALGGPASRSSAQQRQRYPAPVQSRRPFPAFSQSLRLPARHGLFASVHLDRPLQLTAEVAATALLPGPPTLMWSWRGHVEGRRVQNTHLRARRGGTLDVLLENRLEEDTTIHWHGLNFSEANDGSGLHPVSSGSQRRYHSSIRDAAACYWYHPHPHYRTGMQIHQGMAGMLLVEDETDDLIRERLDLEFGLNEIPLIIQDKQIDSSNQFAYEFGEDEWIGNRVLVNYGVEPRLEVQRRLYRFRILNASNSRPLKLAWSDGDQSRHVQLLGTDSGLAPRIMTVTELFLAPAQRVDLLVDFSSFQGRSHIKLVSLPFDPMENDGAAAVDHTMEHPGAVPTGQRLEIMAIDLVGNKIKPPAWLPPSAPMPRRKPIAARRRFRIHIDQGRWLINGRNHHDDHGRTRFDALRNSSEIWEFRNDTVSMPHPMHAHAFRFRVLARVGSPPQIRRMAVDRKGRTPHDLGWLDTVLVWPDEVVRILIDFTQPYSGDQTYMLHCHNLEHEDQGLMLSFRVVDERDSRIRSPP